MAESKEIQTLRAMSWQRSKGELQAYMQTFWPEYSPTGGKVDNGYELADKKIKDFIKDFEGWCR